MKDLFYTSMKKTGILFLWLGMCILIIAASILYYIVAFLYAIVSQLSGLLKFIAILMVIMAFTKYLGDFKFIWPLENSHRFGLFILVYAAGLAFLPMFIADKIFFVVLFILEFLKTLKEEIKI